MKRNYKILDIRQKLFIKTDANEDSFPFLINAISIKWFRASKL